MPIWKMNFCSRFLWLSVVPRCRERRRVGHFMLGDLEADAASTTFASNVAHLTPQVNVHSQVRNTRPLPTPETSKLILLLSSPVTLVRVDRLDFLLHGLCSGFKTFVD